MGSIPFGGVFHSYEDTMSRRSVRWKKAIAQANGDVNKIIPQGAKGQGKWLTDAPSELLTQKPKPGQGRGNTCTLPMKPEKESLVRKLK
jgi:hypothetical protein